MTNERSVRTVVRGAGDARRKLLDAARLLFSTRGMAGARTRELADLAGVDQKLIGYYFNGKGGLYRETLRDAAGALAAELAGALSLAQEDEPVAWLRQALRSVFELVDQHRELVRLLLRDLMDGNAETTREITSAVLPALAPLLDKFHESVASGHLRDVPVGHLGVAVAASAMVPIVPGLAGLSLGTGSDPGAQANALADMLMHGLVRSASGDHG